jgi:hypothetical protein
MPMLSGSPGACCDEDYQQLRVLLHHGLRNDFEHLVELIEVNVSVLASHVARYKRHGPPGGGRVGERANSAPTKQHR